VDDGRSRTQAAPEQRKAGQTRTGIDLLQLVAFAGPLWHPRTATAAAAAAAAAAIASGSSSQLTGWPRGAGTACLPAGWLLGTLQGQDAATLRVGGRTLNSAWGWLLGQYSAAPSLEPTCATLR
jgi:hypothetical protein